MSDWDFYSEAITRFAPHLDMEYQRGTIVHAKFSFTASLRNPEGKHYAIVSKRLTEQTVELLLVSSNPKLASRVSKDCVEIESSDDVPFTKKCYIKCDQPFQFQIENLDDVYAGLLPRNLVSQIETLVQRR